MNLTSIGDLSHALMLQRQSTTAKSDLTRLSVELSTGLKSDTARAVGNDYSVLSSIERALKLNQSFSRAVTEAQVFADTAQAALETVQTNLSDLAPAILSAANSGGFTLTDVNAADAAQRMEAVISAMNVSSAGRRVFAGQATDTAPLASADTMLSDLRNVTAGITDPADYAAAIDAWFEPGGGFESTGYQGSPTPMADLMLDENTRIGMAVTADREGIRTALASLAKVALIPGSDLPAGGAAIQTVMNDAAEEMLKGVNNVSVLRAEIGSSQEAIEQARVRLSVEDTALQISRADILAADPFETATQLEQVRTQLESLYVITARVANLKLSDFLR